MNIREELLKDRSKATCIRIVAFIGHDVSLAKEIVDLVCGSDAVLHQRAAWVLQAITNTRPYLLDGLQHKLLAQLKKENNHDGAKRAIIRHWAEHGFPEEIEGEVYDLCINFIDSKEAIAVKVFSMSACLRVVKAYPELAEELEIVVSDTVERYGPESGAIRSRGTRVLKAIKTINRLKI